jgi:hypothetical protein
MKRLKMLKTCRVLLYKVYDFTLVLTPWALKLLLSFDILAPLILLFREVRKLKLDKI